MPGESRGSIAPEDPILLAVHLEPHRSLTRRGFYVLMMVFSGGSLIWSLPFILLGAWPVAGFMGVDVALFYWAFRANFRAAHAYEDIKVTPFDLVITKVSPRGERAEWRFNPTFVRLERQEHPEFGTERLALVSSGRRVEIGGFLGPQEKASLAKRLSRALIEARQGLRYS
jgi:uncharacterized membrane protein